MADQAKLPIPALPTTAYTTKYAKRVMTFEQKKAARKKRRQDTCKTRIYIGAAFDRWKKLKSAMGFKSDAELVLLLLDSYEKVTAGSTSAKKLSVNSVAQSSAVPEKVCSSDDTTLTADEGSIMEQVDNEARATTDTTEETLNTEGGTGQCTQTNESRTSYKTTKPTLDMHQAELLQLKGKYFMNKNCEHRNLFKSQINHNAPTSTVEHLSSTEIIEITIECPSKNESDISDEDEEPGDKDTSDTDWVPENEAFMEIRLKESLSEENRKNNDQEDSSQENKSASDCRRIKQLCAECGDFYNVQRPHMCEHKTKPYVCNMCGKRCVNEPALKVHSYIHDETYEHPCKYCHVYFKTRLHKLAHQKIHKNNKKPYKCPDCPITFASNKERRVHLKTHGRPKGHKCDICEITFSMKFALARHMIIHTGDKPFKCSVCERRFTQQSHLKSHMRLHTGERPFKCQHCNKSFNHNVSLKSHIQRCHHNEMQEVSANQANTEVTNQMLNDKRDAQDQSEYGADPCDDNVEKELSVVEAKEEEAVRTKKRTSGRLKGRPKKNVKCKIICRSERKLCNLKKHDIDEKSEEHLTGSHSSFDLAQEEEEKERKRAVRKGKSKYQNGSDSDYVPIEETKTKRCRGRRKAMYV